MKFRFRSVHRPDAHDRPQSSWCAIPDSIQGGRGSSSDNANSKFYVVYV